MCLKLREQQLKIVTYIQGLLFINVLVTINIKSIINTQTKKKKESKHNTKDSHQITGEENKRRRKGKKKPYKSNPKTINKLAIRTYISIITLNVNRLNSLIKRHRLA